LDHVEGFLSTARGSDLTFAALKEALKDPVVIAKFADLSAVPATPEQATPDALRTHLKSEIDKYGPLIKKAGVFAD